jgi:hypothetical protein
LLELHESDYLYKITRVKLPVCKHCAMNVYEGVEISVLLTVAVEGGQVVSFILYLLPLKGLWDLREKRLNGSQSQAGHSGEEKNPCAC